MRLTEIITLIIATWGAILSTILGIQKFIIEKKNIQITLVEMVWQAAYAIRIVNIGHRPVTINEIKLSINSGDGKIPSNARFKIEQELPLTLTDGGLPAEFYLTDTLYKEIYYKHAKLNIVIFDTEGRIYKKYNEEIYDEKFNTITKKK
jgi:hypothetical protein